MAEKMSLVDYLRQRWADCRRCGLCAHRRTVVVGSGLANAEILYIGEAPGKSEDLRGEPFIGPSGRVFRLARERAAELSGRPEPPGFITNVVACRPVDNRDPFPDEAMACWPRLEETFQLLQPKFVLFLGRVADKFCRPGFPSGIHLVHPAYILRVGGTESPYFLRFARVLADVFQSL